jgi:hypothetical protein
VWIKAGVILIRYIYINKAYRDNGAKHGFYCDPVKNDRDRCIIGKNGNMLVVFEDGVKVVVIRRCLRLVKNELIKKAAA